MYKKSTIACLSAAVLLFAVAHGYAKQATSCYEAICATITVPDCVEPGKDYDEILRCSSRHVY